MLSACSSPSSSSETASRRYCTTMCGREGFTKNEVSCSRALQLPFLLLSAPPLCCPRLDVVHLSSKLYVTPLFRIISLACIATSLYPGRYTCVGVFVSFVSVSHLVGVNHRRRRMLPPATHTKIAHGMTRHRNPDLTPPPLRLLLFPPDFLSDGPRTPTIIAAVTEWQND